MFKSYRALFLTVLTLACIATFAAPAATAGDRLKVDIGEPFEVNGELYPAGMLTVREIGQLSPVATLNKVCVDGACLSFIFTEAASDEGRAIRDELIFTRSADGHLVLDAVAWSGEPVRGMLVDPAPSRAAASLMAANER